MKPKPIHGIAAVVGVICGIASNYSFLKGSWMNLSFWAVVGLMLGSSIKKQRDTAWPGIIYGTALTLTFLFAGFKGTPDKLPGFILLALFLSIVGAICGICFVFVGNMLRKRRS